MERKVMLIINTTIPVTEFEMDSLLKDIEKYVNDEYSAKCHIVPLPEHKVIHTNNPSENQPENQPENPIVQCPECKGKCYNLVEYGKIPCNSCGGKGIVPKDSMICRICGTVVSDSIECLGCNAKLTNNIITPLYNFKIKKIFGVEFNFNNSYNVVKNFRTSQNRSQYLKTIKKEGVKFVNKNKDNCTYPYHSISTIRMFLDNVTNAAKSINEEKLQHNENAENYQKKHSPYLLEEMEYDDWFDIMEDYAEDNKKDLIEYLKVSNLVEDFIEWKELK